MFVNRISIKKMKEKGNLKALYRAAKHRKEIIWTMAIDSLLEIDVEVEWELLFSKLSQEKQNYCVNMIIHRLAVSEHREKSLNIIKKIGEAAAPAVLYTFYEHVNTIRTTADFDKLQSWLEELLSIVMYCKPSQAVNLFIEIYKRTSNDDVRYMVLEYLGQLGGEQAIEFIKGQLTDELIFTRAAAIKALGLTQDSKCVPVILDELNKNIGNSLYEKTCLEALIDIGDNESIEILASYLQKEMKHNLKERIAEALLGSPYIEMKDVENWFNPDTPYEIREILIKAVVTGNHINRISTYVIKCVTQICLDFYSKGNDIYSWGVKLLQIKKKDALEYLVALLLEKEYENMSGLDMLISEFNGYAFDYLKAIYPLIDTNENKGRIIRLIESTDNHKLARFLIQNIKDISCLFSLYIRRKDEEKILELIEIVGNALKQYRAAYELLESIETLLLSKCRQAQLRDEERFFIKMMYHFYKYFYFEELEEFFIMYLEEDSTFWRYAIKALEHHETDRSMKTLEQYMLQNPHNDKEIVDTDE